MTTPREDLATEPTASNLAPVSGLKDYRFGRAVVIVLMVGPALVLLASLVFTVFDLLGHPLGG